MDLLHCIYRGSSFDAEVLLSRVVHMSSNNETALHK